MLSQRRVALRREPGETSKVDYGLMAHAREPAVLPPPLVFGGTDRALAGCGPQHLTGARRAAPWKGRRPGGTGPVAVRAGG
jgi:hypothetical protein